MTNIADDLLGQRTRRINSLKDFDKLKIDPFTPQATKPYMNQSVKDSFSEYEGKELTLSGRLMSMRTHGKLIFGDIQDASGVIQICIKKDELTGDLAHGYLGWDELNLVDNGDIIETQGTVNKTNQGEITLFLKKLRLLTKAIRALPLTLTEKEQQFRKRYLDLVINPERKKVFERKSKFWKVSRAFLDDKGYLEVETPILEHVTGGADARPFITHHNTLDQDFYLRISTELYQKRLIGGGFEKIYTLGPNFRNEGMSDEHLQEYYQLEWYTAYSDYRDGMKLVRELFTTLAKEVYGKTEFTTRGHTFDLAGDWTEIDYTTAIKDKFDIDIFTATDEEMEKKLNESGIKLTGAVNRNRLIDNLWKVLRKTVSGPAFLINHPKFISPLAKSHPENPDLTQRFQVIIAGSELGNGYSEINDPRDQLERFLEQQNLRDGGDDEAQMLDIDFVEMLEYGMPPTCGYGHSERVFWFFEDITAREGTLFPQMRSEVDELTKKIYAGKVNFKKSSAAPKITTNANIQGLPQRDEAEKILIENVKDKYQLLHAHMVALAMESYANEYGENVDLWYLTGLLHDLDYFKHNDEHPKIELGWFSEWGYPKALIQAVSAHAYASKRTDTPPTTRLDFALVACDELSGFLYAYSLMRPTGFDGMEVSSVIKKFKNLGFAAKIDRDEISTGVKGMNIELSSHIERLIKVFSKMKELKK